MLLKKILKEAFTIDYFGIDISKKSSAVAHYKNEKFQKEFTIQNNQNGYNYLLKYLSHFDQCRFIFESTGIYSRGMAHFCRINKIDYVEMNPLEVKFKTSSLRSWKTDQADPHKLVRLAPYVSASKSQTVNSGIFIELRERARFHLEIENNQNRLKVEMIEVLHQTFPGLEKLFENRYSMIALNIAEAFPHAKHVVEYNLDTLITLILNSTDKGLSLLKAEKYAKKLIKLAQESYPNVGVNSFLVEKAQLLIQQIKSSIILMKN